MPESGQPYGSRARQVLSDLAFGRIVRVAVQDMDRYGRTVGRVYAGTVDVNAEMVRRGAAWSTGTTATTLPCWGLSRLRGSNTAGFGPCRRHSASRLGVEISKAPG
jgi:hypothetical protein